jgi:hypothetical protein
MDFLLGAGSPLSRCESPCLSVTNCRADRQSSRGPVALPDTNPARCAPRDRYAHHHSRPTAVARVEESGGLNDRYGRGKSQTATTDIRLLLPDAGVLNVRRGELQFQTHTCPSPNPQEIQRFFVSLPSPWWEADIRLQGQKFLSSHPTTKIDSSIWPSAAQRNRSVTASQEFLSGSPERSLPLLVQFGHFSLHESPMNPWMVKHSPRFNPRA